MRTQVTNGSINSSRQMRHVVAGTLVLLVMLALTGFSQEVKIPEAGYVYPPALVIGQTNSVTLGGYDWTDDLQWLIDSPAISITEVSLPGDYILTPPPYWIGPRASTNALPIPREVTGSIVVQPDAVPGFVHWQTANANGVGKASQFILTDTPDVLEQRLPKRPQSIPAPPVAVAGRLSRLTEVDVYEFTATVDGPISIELMARQLNSDFNGVIEVRNEQGKLIADFSDTLGQDGSLSFSAIEGVKYSIAIHDVDFRGDRAYIYRLILSPGPHVDEKPLLAGVPEVAVSDLTREQGGRLPLNPPVAVTGTWTPDSRVHCYEWNAAEQSWWKIHLQSRAIGSPLDVALRILDSDGNEVAQADDVGQLTDPQLSFLAKTAGTYVIEAKCADPPTGNTVNQYRLQVKPESPGFQLTVPQIINLPTQGKVPIDVQVQREGGFSGPVMVQCSDLPPGVAIEGDATVPEGKESVKLTLAATADAKVRATPIHFSGTATIDGSERIVAARAAVAGNLAPRVEEHVYSATSMLAITMPAPFRILVVDRERQRDVPRGTTCLADLIIERNDGFDGELLIAMSARQARDRQGIRGPLLKVPAGTTRIQYPCFLPEWLATDLTRRIVVHGVGAVPDADGNVRWLTSAADARITMIMEGALLKVELEQPQCRVPAGGEVQVPVRVLSSSRIKHPVTLTLDVPQELQGKFQCDELQLNAEAETGTLSIHAADDSQLHGQWDLVVRATTLDEQGYPVVAQATVDILVISPTTGGQKAISQVSPE